MLALGTPGSPLGLSEQDWRGIRGKARGALRQPSSGAVCRDVSGPSLRGRGEESQGARSPVTSPGTRRYSVHYLGEEKKNKSALLHAAKLPLKDLTTPLASPAESWLPEQRGPEEDSVGGSAWGSSPVLIPTPWT